MPPTSVDRLSRHLSGLLALLTPAAIHADALLGLTASRCARNAFKRLYGLSRRAETPFPGDASNLTRKDPVADVKCPMAVDLIFKHLSHLRHPEPASDGGTVLRLVQFGHDSPGLRVYKRQIAESLVLLLESNGLLLHNGLTEAADTLRASGYTVSAPGDASE